MITRNILLTFPLRLNSFTHVSVLSSCRYSIKRVHVGIHLWVSVWVVGHDVHCPPTESRVPAWDLYVILVCFGAGTVWTFASGGFVTSDLCDTLIGTYYLSPLLVIFQSFMLFQWNCPCLLRAPSLSIWQSLWLFYYKQLQRQPCRQVFSLKASFPSRWSSFERYLTFYIEVSG